MVTRTLGNSANILPFRPRHRPSGEGVPAELVRLASSGHEGRIAGAVLHEVVPATHGDAGHWPLALTMARRESPASHAAAAPGAARATGLVLWTCDAPSLRERGRPGARALAGAGIDPRRVVLVAARDAREALWAMETGLRCGAVGLVVGEFHADPRALDFTASRRLAMAAERHGTPCVVVRDVEPSTSAARRRWRIAAAPSAPDPFDPRAPGAPRWRVELVRARDGRPGAWTLDAGGLAALVDPDGGEGHDAGTAPHAGVTADAISSCADAIHADRRARA